VASLPYREQCLHCESKLAIEDPELATILLDGAYVANDASGWWVDEAIKTINLPAMSAGIHEIIVKMPFHRKTNLEWMIC